MDLDKLFWIVPPAIIVGVIAYLIKFFGRVIIDFIPYCDDRRYAAEINGITFFIAFVMLPSIYAVAIYLLLEKITGITKIGFFPLFISSVLLAFLSLKNVIISLDFFHRKKVVKKYEKLTIKKTKEVMSRLNLDQKKLSERVKSHKKPIKNGWLQLICSILILSGIYQYFYGNILLTALNVTFIISSYLFIVTIFAMNKRRIQEIEINLKKGGKVKGFLLMHSEDKIRVKIKEDVHIINWNSVDSYKFLPIKKK
ncbi:hypothetical protein KY361_05265 [Candidatus Woesearchaeota archaeon]|nr:hypothetical protein [Candidatus Woesearchaeota archaeon]